MDLFRAEGLLRLTLVTQKIARFLASEADLTVSEFHCLLQLHLEKPCCVRRLTDILGIGATSTSKLLSSLDGKGWITRSLNKNDHRMEVVLVTKQGAEVIHRIMEAADTAAAALIDQLPPDRRGPFTECIHTVTSHMRTFSHHN